MAFGIITLVYRKNKQTKNYHELSLVSVYDIISTRRTSLNKERANKQDLIESYLGYVLLRYVLIYNLEVSFNFHLTFLQLNVIKMFTVQ